MLTAVGLKSPASMKGFWSALSKSGKLSAGLSSNIFFVASKSSISSAVSLNGILDLALCKDAVKLDPFTRKL